MYEKPEYHYNRLFTKLDDRDEGKVKDSLRSRRDESRRVDFRLNIGRSSFFYQASRLWSSIDDDIKKSETKEDFKRKAKIWTMRNIPIKH